MGAGTEVDMYVMAGRSCNNSNHTRAAAAAAQAEDEMDLRRGPWTVEEDLILVNYIANHGEGRWNSLARAAGLKRTGKSCRLRWLNYLRPDVRRGNITPEEQLLILELHSRWGNRWSKIAQHLPGRTDNEIKNYWRTRVQKHAKQLKCEVNSQQFKDVMRYLWMPRLMEKIRAASATSTDPCAVPVVPANPVQPAAAAFEHVKFSPDNSSLASSSWDSSVGTDLPSPPVSELTDGYVAPAGIIESYAGNEFPAVNTVGGACGYSETLLSPCGYFSQGLPDFEQQSGWGASGEYFSSDDLWMDEDFLFLQQQLQ